MSENRDEWWPFETDAKRDDPLTGLRIAVSGAYPRWCYLVAFDVESPERPTDAEARMLQSYLHYYIDHWYNDSYKAKLARRALDVDGGANGVTFHKYGTDDWGYRRRTWDRGPTFFPVWPAYRERFPDEPYSTAGPLALPALMDHIHTIVDHVFGPWSEWKAAHPEVFGAGAVSR